MLITYIINIELSDTLLVPWLGRSDFGRYGLHPTIAPQTLWCKWAGEFCMRD